MYKHKEGASLRKVERSDLKQLLVLKEESWWGTHSVTMSNMVDQERWLENLKDVCMIAEIMDDNGLVQPVGVGLCTDIDWINRTGKLSGSIYKEWRSPQNSRAAFLAGLDFSFEMLNLRRIEAEVMEYHIPAQNLEIGLLGFTVEGRKRKSVYKCGRYYDSLVLGILRDEWEQQDRVKSYDGCCNLGFDHHKAEKLIRRFGIKLNRPATNVW